MVFKLHDVFKMLKNFLKSNSIVDGAVVHLMVGVVSRVYFMYRQGIGSKVWLLGLEFSGRVN